MAIASLGASTYIAAEYATVWDAWTTAEGYAPWASSACIEFGSRAGDRLIWGNAETIVYVGEILTLAPGSGLSHTFSFQGFGFDETSTVVARIEPRGEVVFVDIRHDVRAPRTAEIIGELGWLKALARLKTWLETGREMPWPDA